MHLRSPFGARILLVAYRLCAADESGGGSRLGAMVRGFDEERWREHRFEIVAVGNEHKFGQNQDLAGFLAATGSMILVEASSMDRIWGIGLAKEAPEAQDPMRWRGLNLLGFALMRVRDRLGAAWGER